MKKNKYIKEIAKNLPVVIDKTVSGFYKDYNEQGEEQLFPNIVSHPINHERRLRRAYEKLGMEGVKQYLYTIYNLQLQHNDLQNSQNLSTQGEHSDSLPGVSEDGPPVPVADDKDTSEL